MKKKIGELTIPGLFPQNLKLYPRDNPFAQALCSPGKIEIYEGERSPTVSDDFIVFCQTGKYPISAKDKLDFEVIAENQYIHNVKKSIKSVLQILRKKKSIRTGQ